MGGVREDPGGWDPARPPHCCQSRQASAFYDAETANLGWDLHPRE